MGQKSIKGSPELAEAIKRRRHELNLTIEEAASKAEIGTKTWCRYEAGESIRVDKYKGICKALNWRTLPGEGAEEGVAFDFNEYKNHKAWSQSMKEEFGDTVAISFVIGSDILLDYIQEDLDALSAMPKGTHIGQLAVSQLEISLPSQFLMQYDYNFLYALRATVLHLQAIAHSGNRLTAHSVLEELALYLVVEEARFLIESMVPNMVAEGIEYDDHWYEWIYELFDDDDLVAYLFTDGWLPDDHPYHFNQWNKEQFWK